jgi:hypothetical protein
MGPIKPTFQLNPRSRSRSRGDRSNRQVRALPYLDQTHRVKFMITNIYVYYVGTNYDIGRGAIKFDSRRSSASWPRPTALRSSCCSPVVSVTE